MTFLPIVERELRVRARRKSTYRFRLLAALGAILLVGFLLLAAEGSSSPGHVGKWMFDVLAWVAFLYCLNDGARHTADCLSEEKRSGTLGLLFLTDLRGYDVVLGKLMAMSLNSFYGMLAIFPPLAIPLVIGGVTVGEFWRLVLVLLDTLFFSLTVGLLVSAASRDERRAWGSTVGLLLLFAGALPLLGNIGAGSILAPFSPTTAFLGLFDNAYRTSPDRYWAAVRNLNLLSWAFLAAASFVLPRAWQDRPLRSNGRLTRMLPEFARRENPERILAERQDLLDANPMVWLASRGQGRRPILWTFVGLVAVVALGGWFFDPGTQSVSVFLFITTVVSFLVLAMWVVSEACHLFASARDSGALELLLCTPMSTKQIVRGNFLGLRRIFFRPVVALVVLLSLLMVAQFSLALAGGEPRLSVGFTFGFCAFQLLLSVMDLFAVAHFGMWMGLSQKKPARAVTRTVLLVLVLPMTGLCCYFLWPFIGVAKDLMFISYAQEQLRRHFRSIVTDRYGVAEEADVVGRPSTRARQSQLPPVLNR